MSDERRNNMSRLEPIGASSRQPDSSFLTHCSLLIAHCSSIAPVSVVVPVKDEAENLRRCLPALAWADEVFVVDSQSNDETAAVVAENGAQLVQFHFNG